MASSDVVAGLRELADFLEANPGFKLPHDLDQYGVLNVFPHEPELFRDHIRALGDCEKFSTSWSIGVRRKFGPITVEVVIPHEAVCERRVLGTEKKMVVDPDAPKIEQDVEIVQWVCPDSFLAVR